MKNMNLKGLIVKVSVGVVAGVLVSVFVIKPAIEKKQLENKEVHIRKELKAVENTKEEVKEESKEEVKEESKEEVKEESKEEVKEESVSVASLNARSQEVFYFNKKDVSMTSNLVESEDMRKMLAGTELESLSDAFLELEDKYGVNAIFVASIASVESAYGSSDIAKQYNNITSIMKGDGTPVYFNSRYECLEYTYRLLSKHYIDPNGDWYNGVDVYSINEKYCPDDNYHWANTVTAVMDRLLNKL